MNGSSYKFSSGIKKFLVVIAAAFLTILLTQDYLFTFAPLKELELKLIDARFQRRGKIDIADSSKVIILEITQDSYYQIPQPFNRWPWPRSIFAKVIDNLTKAGVKAVGIDIDMPGLDQFSPMNDSLMREAIRKSGRVVLAGKVDEANEKLIAEDRTNIKRMKEDYDNIFYGVDSSLGIVQPPQDYDGVFRRYLPYLVSSVIEKKLTNYETVEKKVPSFGFALLNKYFGLKNNETAKRQDGFFLLGGKKIPQFDRYTVLINPYGSSGTFPRIKLIDVLDDKDFKTKDEIELGVDINTWDELIADSLSRNRYKDKIVIIGSTMPEDRDQFPFSFAEGKQKGDNRIYGVEFHANIVQNILSGNYLSLQSKGSELLEIFLVTAIVFYISSFIRKIKLRRAAFLIEVLNVLFAVAFVFLIYELSVYFFIHHKLVIAIVSPALAVVVGYLSSTAYHFLQERQQNVLIKGMFSQYVSREIVNELLVNPDKLRLGGERKNLSILFSDIAGFTTFAERKLPEELVSFINEFLNEMTEIILDNDGTLDKYLGDAVMAFWGAPIEVKEHSYKACLTALQMQKKLVEMREKWTASGETPIRIRIGINSGDVIVGNIGGEKRFDYTVLGDDVNLASRLEGANKEYGTNIMISGSTFENCKDKILVRELDVIRVKGKTEPTKVYELISVVGDKKAEEAIEKMDLYFQAIDLYRHKSFESAHDYFKRSYEKLGDYPSKVYMQRCEFYIANPPEKDWDGVFEMKTK